MVAVIVGEGGMLDDIKAKVPEKAWKVPAGDNLLQQVRFLAANPVRRDGHGFVFTNVEADWRPVTAAGWRVYWCSPSHEPMGAYMLPPGALQMSLSDFTHRFWGIRIVDKRLVSDVLSGQTQDVGVVMPITSCTGGVGKTVTSRRTSERAAEQGLRTLLVDANMRQSSQRSFFDPNHSMRVNTVFDWTGGEPFSGVNHGSLFGVKYDIAFAPPTGQIVEWEHYRKFIEQARKQWEFIVVDLDRISVADLDDPTTAAGGIVVPYSRSGDPCLFIVKAGRQTQSDAMMLVSALPRAGMPRECVGIKDTVPPGMSDYTRFDYSAYGTFLGTEHQSDRASALIAEGKSNWSDPDLDLVRENVLAWALPDAGFDPSKYGGGKRGKKKRGLFR